MDLGMMLILFLFSGLDCVKVVKYKSKLDGIFTISNFSLDSLDEFSLCLRVFSYSFSSPYERLKQSLVSVGDKIVLGILTQQHCYECNTSQTFFMFFSPPIFFLSRLEIFWFLGARESAGIF